jgi:Uma2 family endonuclease
MTQQATKLITAEELFAMGDIGRCELIKGEIIRMAPAGAEHGDIALELGRLIGNHVKQHKLGKTYAAETGFTISRHDVAVEVVSPSDTHSDLATKVAEWLAAGTISVWVVDPPNKTVEIHRAGNQIFRIAAADTIRDEPTLPGFMLIVNELFE